MTNADPIEAEVLGAFQGLVDASRALDSRGYLEYIDKEKFTGLADGKVWHSFQDLEQLITTGFPMVDKIVALEFPTVKVTVIDPSTAILVNEYKQATLLKNGDVVQEAGGGVQVWSKRENGWKLVSISDSKSPPPESN